VTRAAPAGGSADRTLPTVVAARALPAGHLLTRADLRTVPWPRAVRPGAARGDPDEVAGRRLLVAITAGEPVTTSRVLGSDLLRRLPPGTAAAAVPVADRHAVDLVRPGDRVDVLATPRVDDVVGTAAAGARTVVRTVVRAAAVLAVFADSPTAPDDGGGAEAVLEVPRGTAAALARDAATDVFTVVVVSP
jgi:Flp pilus assembly protein CpaB